MSSLADMYTDESYLPEGWFEVKVISHKMYTTKDGQGVEFTLADETGRTQKQGFSLAGKGPYYLAQFAKACGMTLEEMKDYDYDVPAAHSVLHGSRCKICVHKEGKYHNITETVPSGSDTPEFRPAFQRPESADVPATETPAEPLPESIPF